MIYSVPQFGVQSRIQSAVSDVQTYFAGDSHTSVGARFEMWRGASQLFMQKPLFGWGEAGYEPAMRALVEQGRVDKVVEGFTHPHNELLDAAAKRGLLGLAAAAATRRRSTRSNGRRGDRNWAPAKSCLTAWTQTA